MAELNAGPKDYIRRCVAEALFRLMNAKDYKAISIGELCAEAGVSRSTFYRYFSDKDTVIESYLDHWVSDFLAETGPIPDTEEGVYAYTLSILKLLEANKSALKALHKSGMSLKFLEFLSKTFAENTALTEGYRAIFAKYPMLPYAYAGNQYNIYMHWVMEDCRTPKEQVADTIFLSIYSHEHTKTARQN